MNEFLQQVAEGFASQRLIDWGGLIFGLLAVYFLIKENILTWPAGIIYCVISFFVFWEARLYQDFILHIFFLFMNIFGWIVWRPGSVKKKGPVLISWSQRSLLTKVLLISVILIGVSGFLFKTNTDADLPYFDATTSVLSLSAMWMTAKKKLENWIIWFVVDIVAAGMYLYKGLYFYSFLYFIYLGMAVIGYLNWIKLYKKQQEILA